jgi:conjugal transfer pilus assembly protein TraB
VPATPARRELKIWPEEAKASTTRPSSEVTVTIPVNSALEAFMLSGINARPSGAISAAIGSVNSATSVGAPFVTRIKGNAILPNGWKVADLGDCFLGGSGTAVLSAERAYVIADKMSCIAADGEVWEGEVQAYGLDIDGTLGLAGKVVSKQGSLLAQAALTGMVSGLSSALSPQAVPAYNSSATGGSQSYQTPDPRMLAATAVGQGVGSAAAQLSKIYLDYAKELFPVVEVTAGTRVTWVLRASMELKRRPMVRNLASATN